MITNNNIKIGVVFGNRGFFSGNLCLEARSPIFDQLEKAGCQWIALGEQDSDFGAVSNLLDAEKCIRIFKENEIDGLLISLPNFGDESSLLEVARRGASGLPILVQAFPDRNDKLQVGERRDAFCGKISVCNNLSQSGIPFNLTGRHVVHPSSSEFSNDLADFLATCRIVKQMQSNRLGQIGVRPDAFRTVRYSEKILEKNGQSVYQISLERIVSRAKGLDSNNQLLNEMRKELSQFQAGTEIRSSKWDQDSIERLARLGAAINEWIRELSLDAYAIQCWTDIQDLYGIMPCAVMSILGQGGVPGACEADILGAVSMLALQAASGHPAALVDWNNNYLQNPDQAILFHCSNFPAGLFEPGKSKIILDYHPVLADVMGKENVFGSLSGNLISGDITFLRLTTKDHAGLLHGYSGSGEIIAENVNTFGGSGVVEIPAMEQLLRYICLNGFEHHAAICSGNFAAVIAETLEKYLGWPIHQHM